MARASLTQKLSHSFVTTLFYFWTVMKALFSLRSPVPFPFKETSAVVPCAIDIDLERGATIKRDHGRRTYPMPPPPPFPSALIASLNVVTNAAGDYVQAQNNLKFSPDSPSSPDPLLDGRDAEFTDVDLSASVENSLVQPPNPPIIERVSRRPRKTSTHTTPKEEANLDDTTNLSLDPFLEVKPVSFSTHGNQLKDAEPLLFAMPLCTSTPPRSRRGGKGHKRETALAMFTNLDYIDLIPNRCLVASDSLPSLAETDSVVDTPSARRQRSSSLRGSPAFGGFNSPPPVWSTPRKAMPSIIVQSSTPHTSSQEPHFKPITPLRIVKRNKSKGRGSTTSEVSKAVISAMRDAFVESRQEHQEEVAEDPRDLLNRESVWTCDMAPVGSSKCDISAVLEGDETESECPLEAASMSPTTPPPPYTPSNPAIADELKRSASKVFLDMKRCSVSTQGSTELQYLTTQSATTLVSSVDSCLDDILASFEHLMATMPEYRASKSKAQGAVLSTIAKRETNGLGLNPSAGLGGGGPPQWSDVLGLENY